MEGDVISAYVRQNGKPVECVLIYGLINDYSEKTRELLNSRQTSETRSLFYFKVFQSLK